MIWVIMEVVRYVSIWVIVAAIVATWRNHVVSLFMTRWLLDIELAAKRDIAAGFDYSWRMQAYHEALMDYHKMIFIFWRKPESLFPRYQASITRLA